MVHTPTQTHTQLKSKKPPINVKKARGPPVATAGNPEKARSRAQSSLLKTPQKPFWLLKRAARNVIHHPGPCRVFLGRNMVTVGAVAFPYFYSRFVILT